MLRTLIFTALFLASSAAVSGEWICEARSDGYWGVGFSAYKQEAADIAVSQCHYYNGYTQVCYITKCWWL